MRNLAVIDLNLLRENASRIREKLPKNVKFCAVVKADAYGHGAEIISNALYPFVDMYAVAIVEEAISLRLSSIDKDILILNPLFNEDVFYAVYYDLTVTVDTIESLIMLENECEKQNKQIKVHIKYNVGMNRYGVNSINQLSHLLKTLNQSKRLIFEGFYSHLSNPSDKKTLIKEKNKFILALEYVKGYNNKVISHLSASGGLITGEYFDMVRIGILLYGYKPFPTAKISVKPIMKLYSPIVKTREVNSNENLFYGKNRLKNKNKIFIARYGYADGLPRKKASGILANRCMDVSAYNTCNGDYVKVLDDADVLAKNYDTISYEILTKIAVRAEKIYLK